MFGKWAKAAEEPVVELAEEEPKAEADSVFISTKEGASAWKAYDEEVARLNVEAAENPPNGAYRIVRLEGSEVWVIQRWCKRSLPRFFEYRNTMQMGIGSGLPMRWFRPPAPSSDYRYEAMNKLEFKSREEAATWLYESLRSEERTFGYDAEGNPL